MLCWYLRTWVSLSWHIAVVDVTLLCFVRSPSPLYMWYKYTVSCTFPVWVDERIFVMTKHCNCIGIIYLCFVTLEKNVCTGDVAVIILSDHSLTLCTLLNYVNTWNCCIKDFTALHLMETQGLLQFSIGRLYTSTLNCNLRHCMYSKTPKGNITVAAEDLRTTMYLTHLFNVGHLIFFPFSHSILNKSFV